MSRRKTAVKRKIKPDFLYKEVKVEEFVNLMMWDGEKNTARKIVYKALEIVGLETFLKALENVQPTIEIRSRRVGGATYQVPTAIRPSRASYLARRFIVKAARSRAEKTMVERLAAECKDAVEEKGSAFKKKIEMQRTAASNQAFAHYSWA